MSSEASHVHFINDRAREWPFKRCVTFPIICVRIHHDALHGSRRVLIVVANSVAAVVLRNNYTSALWIEEHFDGIKTQTVLRVPGSMHAIAITFYLTQNT